MDPVAHLPNPALIAQAPRWIPAQNGAAITRALRFDDFARAWTFMNLVATEAQKMNHHPNWSNNYNRVDISLSSHDAGGVTSRDIALALAIDTIAQRLNARDIIRNPS